MAIHFRDYYNVWPEEGVLSPLNHANFQFAIVIMAYFLPKKNNCNSWPDVMAVDTNVTDYDNILLQEGVLSTLSHVNFHVARLIIVDFTPKEDIQCQI